MIFEELNGASSECRSYLVASDGEAAWGFTTPAMYRGMADATGRTVAIYADEDR